MVQSTRLREKCAVQSKVQHEKCAVPSTIWRRSLVRLRSRNRSRSRRYLGGGIGEVVVISAWSITRRVAVRRCGCWRYKQKERKG